MPRRRRVHGLALALLLSASPALAQWNTNGNAVCQWSGEQSQAAAVADGAGGAIVVWRDARGASIDLYAQRVTSTGALAGGWPAGGLALCTATGDQRAVVAAADGAGGAFVAWEDYRAGGAEADIYVQRITGAGAIAAGWPANGVPLCTETGGQGYPQIVLSGSDAIVAWQDDRGLFSDIYARRVTAAGAAAWTDNGVALCNATANQMFPSMVADGAGGAIVTWQDSRGGDTGIYAQRIGAAGAVAWTANGLVVCDEDDDQLTPRAIPDAAGGALIAFDDYRDFNSDIYTQRIDGSGARLWTAAGVALCTEASEQYGFAPVADGAGGMFVPWTDYRGGSGDLYVQRVTAAGAISAGWTADGVVAAAANGDPFDAVGLPDGSGGLILTWCDPRNAGVLDIYAQRLTGNGARAGGWSADGDPVCNAAGNQWRPAITTDGSGNAIVAWHDERDGAADIYARRVGDGGAVDVPAFATGAVEFAAPAPNPMRESALFAFQLSDPGPVRLEVFDLAGRSVTTLLAGDILGPGRHTLRWDGRGAGDARVPPGLYLATLQAGGSRLVRKLALLH